MSVSRTNIIRAVCIVGVFIIGVGIIQWVRDELMIGCSYKDKNICRFLRKQQSQMTQDRVGTYVETFEGTPVYSVDWNVNDEDQELVYRDGDEETMHVMVVGDYLYLKDVTDGRWWQQKLEEIEQYETHLPFEPQNFFAHMQSQMVDPATTIVFAQTDICSMHTCLRYTLRNPQSSTQTTSLFIDETDFSLRKVLIEDGSLHQEITIDFESVPIQKPEEHIKVATVGDNIFLQHYIDRTVTSPQTPGYVQQFEQARREAEREGFSQGSLEYIDPFASPTVAITPTPTPTLYPFSDDEAELKRQLDGLLEEANYCIVATDCVGVSYACPFGCTLLVNKNHDLATIEQGIEQYFDQAPACTNKCASSPQATDIACVSGRCIDRRAPQN